MSYQFIKSYKDACQTVSHWGILPLSSFIPEHPSLEALTGRDAWHTGLDTDPWLWRDRFPREGVAAYGRFLAGKPVLISRELFPLVKCLLSPSEAIAERFAAGTLARSALHVYQAIEAQEDIDVKTLRKVTDMQRKSEKNEFDHALLDLQLSTDIVIAGISARLNAQGNKSGWNSTCYMVAERWMEQHQLEVLSLARTEAQAQLLAWLEARWEGDAVSYVRKKLRLH